jgi:hypothetical protein
MADAVRASDTIDARLAKAKPVDPRVRAAAIGQYRNERLGDLDIGEQAGELVVTAGVLSAPLRYLGGDSFLLLGAAASEVETFSLIRDRQGRVVAFLWEDDRYERTPDRGGQRGA